MDLYLQVEQEVGLTLTSTSTASFLDLKSSTNNPADITITFEADSGIEVAAPGINTLADLVAITEPETDLPFTGQELKSKVVKSYLDKSKKINIKATTDSNQVRQVKIKATKTNSKGQSITQPVGLLCIYPNAAIKSADITMIPYIISKAAPASPMPTKDILQHYINEYFLNQSLTQSKINTSLENTYKGNLVALFKWQWNIIRKDRSIK